MVAVVAGLLGAGLANLAVTTGLALIAEHGWRWWRRARAARAGVADRESKADGT